MVTGGRKIKVESSWNVMAHGDEKKGQVKGETGMEWVASTLHTTSEHGVSSITTAVRTPRLPAVDWTDSPADLNGLIRFAERRILVSALVPSHFKRSLHTPCHLPWMRRTSHDWGEHEMSGNCQVIGRQSVWSLAKYLSWVFLWVTLFRLRCR